MKLVIEIDEAQNYGLAPPFVYRRLCEEHVRALVESRGNQFWGLHNASDRSARELLAQMKKEALMQRA